MREYKILRREEEVEPFICDKGFVEALRVMMIVLFGVYWGVRQALLYALVKPFKMGFRLASRLAFKK